MAPQSGCCPGGVKKRHWGVSAAVAALQRSNSMPESGETPTPPAAVTQPQPSVVVDSPAAAERAAESRTPSSDSTC